MINLLFSHFILFVLSLLFSVMSIAEDHIKNTDMVIPQIAQQEIDLVYYKVFPLHKFLKHTDIPDCTVKPETVSLRQKNHDSVLICREQVDLLREKKTIARWQKENRLHGFILLDMPEMGIHHIKAHIIAVKSASKFNDNNIAYLVNNHIKRSNSMRPVTGVFIRHVTNVRQYLLKNSRTGHISAVNATPEHRFYVSNRQAFIPIADVSLSDRLITDTGEEVRIIADVKGRERKQQHDKGHYSERLKTVYNLEIAEKHTYFISELRVFVHNPYVCMIRANGTVDFVGAINGVERDGVFCRSNGTMEYMGSTKNFKYHGQGCLHDSLGRKIYKGGWMAHMRNGYGESFSHGITDAESQEVACYGIYSGYWKNDKYHGEGKRYFGAPGQKYNYVELKGQFSEGLLIKGRVYSQSVGKFNRYRLVYDGELKNGKYSGSGIAYSYDNDGNFCLKMVGEWCNGGFYEGNIFDKDGVLKGEYTRGEQIIYTDNPMNYLSLL